jgi:hypothetical protein
MLGNQRLVLAMENSMKHRVLTLGDWPLFRSFQMKTVLYISSSE